MALSGSRAAFPDTFDPRERLARSSREQSISSINLRLKVAYTIGSIQKWDSIGVGAYHELPPFKAGTDAASSAEFEIGRHSAS